MSFQPELVQENDGLLYLRHNAQEIVAFLGKIAAEIGFVAAKCESAVKFH